MNVGIIGIGIMGRLVARALLEGGYKVVGYDVVPHACEQAERLGATIAESPRQVAGQAEVVLLVLPGPPQIEATITGAQGLMAGAGPGHVFIDLSTVDPQSTRRMGALVAEHSIAYMDAPILGRPSAFGKWVLPVGGEEKVFARCQPVLSCLGRQVIHVGELGTGNTIKLLNALMFSAINAMTAEMMAICRKAHLSPEVLFNTITASEAATVSGLFKEVGAKIVARDFEPIFPINLLCKDNGLAIEMAKAYNAPPLIASSIQVMNELARSRGWGAEDTSALVKLYESLLDVPYDDVEGEG